MGDVQSDYEYNAMVDADASKAQRIRIERGVQMPIGRSASEYPFAEMAPGDSFAVPVPPGADKGSFSAAQRAAADRFGKKRGQKFRTLLVDGRTSVRTWRVA